MLPAQFPLPWLPQAWRPLRSARSGRHPPFRLLLEQLEDRMTPSGILSAAPNPPAAVYVNPAFTGPAGSDPDGSGPTTAIGYDAFADLQSAINAVADHGTVNVASGSYSGGLSITKTLYLHGDGSATTFVDGTGSGTGLSITGPEVGISGVTVRNFAYGLLANGDNYLGLTDVGLSGNKFGGGVRNVTTLLFAGGPAADTLDVRPDRLARQGDQPLDYSGVKNLTVDGGGNSNRLVVYLNDISDADKIWLNGYAVARATDPFLLWYRDTNGTFGSGISVVLGDGSETAVVQGQMPGAPTTVYGQGGNNVFYVALSASSNYANLTLDGGSGNSSLGVFDLYGGATLRNMTTVNGEGAVVAEYPVGAVSAIGYQNVNQILNKLPGPLSSTLSFASPATFATGPTLGYGAQFYTDYVNSTAVADVNGDGKPDLIVLNQGTGTLSVLLNTTPDGAAVPSFAPQQRFTCAGASDVVRVADINGDGKPDLITAGYLPNSYQVSVLLNTTAPGASTATFAPAVNLNFQPGLGYGPGTASLAVADVNGDGKPDVIIGATQSFLYPNEHAAPVMVLLNTTAPGASTPSFAAPQNVRDNSAQPPVNVVGSVGAADFNADGKPDLVVSSSFVGFDLKTSGTVSVVLNTTAPGATAVSFGPPQIISTRTYESIAAVTDLNGDGKPDVITNGFGLSVQLNTTAAGAATVSFSAPQTLIGTKGAAMADINGDGKPDLIVSDGNKLNVQLNTTVPGAKSLSFAPAQTFVTTGKSYSVLAPAITTGDINLDGRPDLIAMADATVGQDNAVLVQLNTTP